MKQIILASGSEWRQKMISWLDIDAKIIISNIDESQFDCDTPDELVEILATAKAQKVASQIPNSALVIGADTIITINDEIIGKPKDEQDAFRIIRLLSGSMHQVWTGLCLIDCDTSEKQVIAEKTDVAFSYMEDKDIEKYLNSGDWQGKAGAYQLLKSIQAHVESIDGSATNIIGLPLLTLASMLEYAGYRVIEDIPSIIESHTGYRS